MKLLLETDFCSLAYFHEHNTLILKWKKKKISLEEYQKPFLEALRFQKETPFDNFISDVSDQWAIPQEYLDWFRKEAVPVATRQGLKRAALVSGANVFKRFYINHITDTTKFFGLPLKMFKTSQEAKAWIKQLYTPKFA